MAVERRREKEKKSMIIVVPLCLKDADGARTRSDQKHIFLNLYFFAGLTFIEFEDNIVG